LVAPVGVTCGRLVAAKLAHTPVVLASWDGGPLVVKERPRRDGIAAKAKPRRCRDGAPHTPGRVTDDLQADCPC